MRLVHLVLVSAVAASVHAATLAAQDLRLPLKTVEVKLFKAADGVTASTEFLAAFRSGLMTYLPKAKAAEQAIEEGQSVSEADAANSAVIEGTIVAIGRSSVSAEINVYRRSDRQLVKSFTGTVGFKPSPLNKDKNIGEGTGGRMAYEVQRALKKM